MIRRWTVLVSLLAAVATPVFGGSMDFDALRAAASQRAAAPYRAPSADGALAGLERARWRAAALRPQRSPWSMVSRFVPLPLAPRAGCQSAQFNSIELGGIKRFDYRPELFDWPAAGLPAPGPTASGFCGFRLLYPLEAVGTRDEIGRFEADAWQLVGAKQLPGATALTVGVLGGDGRVQPVPFGEYWLVRPGAGAKQLRVYALAESAALVAAFQIDIFPGVESRAEVRLAIYPRQAELALLLAPLAGSFVQGEHRPARVLPLRAEVHEVDGLAIQTASGGRIWRSLNNPPDDAVYSFLVNTPRGFGLLQRDRDASHYDVDAAYPRQPGVWVVPTGDWGNGDLRLLESPARGEGKRNVQVGFVPEKRLQPGEKVEIAYTVRWSLAVQSGELSGNVFASRSGAGDHEGSRRYAVDFVGPRLGGLPPGVTPTAAVDVGRGGRLERQQVLSNPHVGGWRLLFDLQRETDKPLQLRAYLQHDDQPLTETWDYVDLPR